MPSRPPAGARTSSATARNREPILEILAGLLPTGAQVLEIASGAGEHALFFSHALPQIAWRPSDPDAGARASIEAWRGAGGPPNLEAPLALDAADRASWPDTKVDAVVCINMIHISPWAATEGLMAGAERLLSTGGVLFLYGPYLEARTPTAPSNIAFDLSLKSRDPAWGLRQLAEVVALAKSHHLRLAQRIPMAANNLSLIFVRD